MLCLISTSIMYSSENNLLSKGHCGGERVAFLTGINVDRTKLAMFAQAGLLCGIAGLLYPVHKQILEKKPLLIWGNLSKEELDWIFDKLPCQGLAVNVAIESIEQAERIWKRYIG